MRCIICKRATPKTGNNQKYCIPCRHAVDLSHRAAWKKNNREKCNAQMRRKYWENPEENRKKRAIAEMAYKDRRNRNRKKWRLANPDRVREQNERLRQIYALGRELLKKMEASL